VTQEHATAVIDLGALARNVERIKSHVAGPEVMVIVKADGYGHGLVPSAKAAVAGGATWLGVALLQEAITLRAAGVTARILAWLYTVDDQLAECIERDVDIAINGVQSVEAIAAAAESLGKTARVHIKVDTGLNRNGVTIADLPAVLQEITTAQRAGHLEFIGIMSHLAFADEPLHPTVGMQLERFTDALKIVRRAGFEPEIVNLSNSAAALNLPSTHFNVIRPGLAVYGVGSELDLAPAMTLKAPVALVKEAEAGEGVSYSHTYQTKSATRLALIPVGYADGIPRHASNRGPVLVSGQVLQVAGRICMDQFVIDIGSLNVVAGDEVVLFGDPKRGEPSVEDWATSADTISYEILTRLGARVARQYINTPW
jgi:alanine racemase